MTARPLRAPLRDSRLRVISGRRTGRPAAAPWVVVSLIAVVTFLALVASRTALDRAAFDLAALDAAIAEEATLNQQLRIEIAQLENPARIAPMAEELGLVIPTERRQLLVGGVGRDDGIVDPDYTTVQTAEATEPSS
ncbi:MAG: hypothetical protein ACRDVD_08715 [Acidimicrobiia bacterium]